MRIVLASVPHSPPFSPLLGLPMLAAEMRGRGHEVALVDLGMEAFERLWAPASVEAGVEALRQGLAHLERRDTLSRRQARDYMELARRISGAPAAAAAVERALAQLRGRAGAGVLDDWEGYDSALLTLEWALELVSGPFAPEKLSLRSYTPATSLTSEADLIAYARRPPQAFLLGPVLKQLGPELVLGQLGEAWPDAVGISVAWPSQLGPAAAFGQGLREAGYTGAIVWGGALMAHLALDLARCGELRRAGLVDAVVPFGAGAELERYLETRASGADTDVAGVIVPGRTEVEGWDDLGGDRDAGGELPLPDFEGLDLSRYLSPRPVLPLLASIGCYYKRCAFCDHFHSVQRYRPRPGHQVVAEMRQLHSATGCRDFYLVDDCTPPKTLGELAKALSDWRGQGGPEIGWITECRTEKALLADGVLPQLAASGCRMLLFGMESASPAVLEAMAKGVQTEQLQEVVQAAHDAGIGVWCFYMFGFPGETDADAQLTRDFVIEHRDVIDVIAGGPFVLTRHSPIAAEPERFGVQLAPVARPRGGKKKKKNKAGASAPAPASFELIRTHKDRSAAPSAVSRQLRALREDPRLQHFRHPLVVEAHSLFLDRAYYHQDSAAQNSLPMRGGRVDRVALLEHVVGVATGVSVQYFKFPTDAAQLPASGAVPALPSAVVSRPGDAAVHASAPVGALVERCASGAATVAERARETETAGEGSVSDVVDAVIHLVERGLLTLELGPDQE